MKLYKYLFLIILSITFIACSSDDDDDDDGGKKATGIPALTDNDIETFYEEEGAEVTFTIQREESTPITSYGVWSAGDLPMTDPQSWTVSGSNDGATWTAIGSESGIEYCARYHEMLFDFDQSVTYTHFQFKLKPTNGNRVRLSEIKLYKENPDKNWKNFRYPIIYFNNEATATNGSKYYDIMIQDKNAYLQYHAKEVAKLLYYSDQDAMQDINSITYILRDYDGVSAKSGNVPNISIVYSTQHIEKSYIQSLFKLDFETRGVLFHEMTHAYQLDPKGVGNYGNNKIFWSYTEGLADGIRAHSGFLDFSNRRAGGDYRDGYQTTGFFLQWLTTKDPDALRKFHASTRTLDPWSYDGAFKMIFGENVTAMDLWYEYQAYLKSL